MFVGCRCDGAVHQGSGLVSAAAQDARSVSRLCPYLCSRGRRATSDQPLHQFLQALLSTWPQSACCLYKFRLSSQCRHLSSGQFYNDSWSIYIVFLNTMYLNLLLMLIFYFISKTILVWFYDVCRSSNVG